MGKKFIDLVDTSGMTEDQKKMWEGVGEAIDQAIKSHLGDSKVDEKSIKEALFAELKNSDEFKKEDLSVFVKSESFDKKIKEYSDELLEIKSMMEKGFDKNGNVKTLRNQIEDQLKDFISEEKGRKVVDLREACKKSPGYKKTINLLLDKKAAVMSTGVAPHFNLGIDPTIDVEPRSETIIRQYANVTSIGVRSILIGEYVPEAGDAEWVPEGGLKPSMSATLQERTISAGKVALTVKLTEETLTDLPQLVSEIETELIYRIGLEEERGILEGSGVGGEITGVLSSMPGFALTGMTVDRPNKYDAIVAGYTQIISTSKSTYRPNLILMNPIDYASMQLEKGTDGQYLRPFKIGDELIQGLRVVTSTAIEQGSLFIGDFNYLNIRDVVQLSITFGWENDDFTRNMVTMIGEKRLMTYIKRQYVTAFLHDTFDNVITAITA